MPTNSRTTKRDNSATDDFKKTASCELKDLVLIDWDFESFEYKEDKKTVVKDKVVAVFASDSGDGENVAVEMFGKTMDKWEDSEPMEGEMFTLSVNLKSRTVETKDGNTFYAHQLKCWKFELQQVEKRGGERERNRKK